MKVEQAIYGELHGGHALRMASDQSRFAAGLASRLDLPDTAPPGVDWSPFVTGFPYGDRYVIARTFTDPAATRAGMVVSHAVIAPLEEMITTVDLRPCLKVLISVPKPPDVLETRDVPASTEPPAATADLVPAAEALVTRGAGPVVRIGIEAFEDLVAALWFHLWPQLRLRFAFRLSFGPHDVVETPEPSLVCTPTGLAARWTGHRIIGTKELTPISHAAALLSGGEEAQPIMHFAAEIGAILDSFTSLPLIERAYQLGSATNPSFQECVAALRLVESLSPDPAKGTDGKARLIDRLDSRLRTATATEVLLLRNLSTTGFAAANMLWASLESWVASNKFAKVDDPALLSVVDESLSMSTAVEPWRNAILGGIVAALRSTSSAFPAAFWRWADARPATLTALVGYLPKDHELEPRLTDATPLEVSRGAGDAVMRIALSRKWLCLHGAAAGASLAPRDAVLKQLSVVTDPTELDGIRAAMRRVTPELSLAIALEIAEPRLLSLAAQEVARKPQLLEEVDFAAESAQVIWAQALDINAGAWQGPADPQRSFSIVVQNLLEGRPASSELITALSGTPLADLNDYPRRAEVWPRLTNPVRANLLSATAAGWLDRASSSEVPYGPDPQLQTAILAGDRLDRRLLALAPTGAATVIQIVSALPSYDESRFLRWLEGWSETRQLLTAPDAAVLGHLILDRHWQRVADELVRLTRKGGHDVKPALRICHDMIGIWARLSLGLSSVSSDDKWLVFEELAADLYPGGPDYNELWCRAGGRDADLVSYGSGQSRWRYTILQMRRGKGPKPARLLNVMRQDFPLNDRVRYLANDPDLVGTSR